MTNKVIRLSSAILLTAFVSVSLVACGSKKDESSTPSSKASSSVVAKSSSTKKASQSGSKASSSQAESQADSQSDQGSVANATGGQEQGNVSQEASQAKASSDKEAETSDAAVPAELVGTWTGSSQQASEITMTIDAAGNVTTTANFNVDYEPNRTSSTTAKAVQVADNLYVWEGGDFSTLMPGITGLGGAGFQAKPGFYLQNGQYTPVQFISPLGDNFDYSNYNAFPFSLSK